SQFVNGLFGAITDFIISFSKSLLLRLLETKKNKNNSWILLSEKAGAISSGVRTLIPISVPIFFISFSCLLWQTKIFSFAFISCAIPANLKKSLNVHPLLHSTNIDL